MHLEQILNNSCDFKLFEFESSKFSTDHKKIEVQIRNRKIDNVTAIGVDEVQYHKGHNDKI